MFQSNRKLAFILDDRNKESLEDRRVESYRFVKHYYSTQLKILNYLRRLHFMRETFQSTQTKFRTISDACMSGIQSFLFCLVNEPKPNPSTYIHNILNFLSFDQGVHNFISCFQSVLLSSINFVPLVARGR